MTSPLVRPATRAHLDPAETIPDLTALIEDAILGDERTLQTDLVCTVNGCPNDTSKGGHGHCGMHRARVRRTGHPGPAAATQARGRTLEQRIYSRLIESSAGCWIWQGATSKAGYGVVGTESRKVGYVHRLVYADMVAEIPDGLVLDHVCINPPCANPYHLDPVTRAVNNARGGHLTGQRKGAAA